MEINAEVSLICLYVSVTEDPGGHYYLKAHHTALT